MFCVPRQFVYIVSPSARKTAPHHSSHGAEHVKHAPTKEDVHTEPPAAEEPSNVRLLLISAPYSLELISVVQPKEEAVSESNQNDVCITTRLSFPENKRTDPKVFPGG